MTDKIHITTEWLREHEACASGIAEFGALYPDGLLYDPTDAAQAAEILSGPLARHVAWAVSRGLPPHRITAGNLAAATAGDYGTATAGHYGTATAGDYGTATADVGGTATAGARGVATAGARGAATAGTFGAAAAGDHGTATAGHYGTATAGHGGVATVGTRGTATAGARGAATASYRGTASAGERGIVQIWSYDGSRWRIVTGYIGETTDATGAALLPDVPYRLDDEGRFVRADGGRT